MLGGRALPDGVEMSFRPATAADLAYCYLVYADGLRAHVDTLFGWDDAAQQRNFAASFKVEETRIICGRIGLNCAELGWAQVETEPDNLHLKELHIDGPSRGLGLGGWALTQIIDQADAGDKGVCLSALIGSAALRLYRRFGFEVQSCDNSMLRMHRPAALRIAAPLELRPRA